jgi:hypothetical protein
VLIGVLVVAQCELAQRADRVFCFPFLIGRFHLSLAVIQRRATLRLKIICAGVMYEFVGRRLADAHSVIPVAATVPLIMPFVLASYFSILMRFQCILREFKYSLYL